MEPKNFRLPMSVIGRVEIDRMIRELTMLDDFFVAAAGRKAGTPIAPPKLTRMLNETSRLNELNLLEAGARKQMAELLDQLKKTAPSLHISFAAEPPPKAFEQILTWFRQYIHPQTLMQIGLAPNIAAGCVLRTPNKIFDMSLAARLQEQGEYLGKLIEGAA